MTTRPGDMARTAPPNLSSARMRRSPLTCRLAAAMCVGFILPLTAGACTQLLSADGLTGGISPPEDAAAQDGLALDGTSDADSGVSPDVVDEPPAADAQDAPLEADAEVYLCTATDLDCDGNASNGCETDTLTAQKHCGRCGHDCLGGSCAAGRCEPVFLADGQGSPFGIALDRQARRVYWTDASAAGNIGSVSVDGGAPETHATGQASPHGIRAEGGNVFWANGGSTPGTGQVLRLDLTGGDAGASPQVLADGLTNPTALTVADGNVYWANVTNQTGSVMFTAADGSGTPETLAPNLNMPGGLFADDLGVYWTVVLSGTIMSWNKLLSPPAVQTLVSGVSHPAAIAADTLTLYWCTVDGQIQRKSRLVGDPIVTLADGQAIPTGLVVDGEYVYWTNFNGGEVMRIPRAGGEAEAVATGQSSPFDLVDDQESLYWVNRGGSVMRLAK